LNTKLSETAIHYCGYQLGRDQSGLRQRSNG